MRIDEKLKAEIREKLNGVILAIKVAKTVEEHEHPAGGDAVVEVLVEELLQLHSTHGKCEMVLCNGCCGESEPECARAENVCCDDTEYTCCDGEERFCKGDHLTFGEALEAAKRGRKIAREGWNGKGQFVFVAEDLQFNTEADMSPIEGEVYVHDALVFCGTSGIQVGWLASQADMLSEDWFVME